LQATYVHRGFSITVQVEDTPTGGSHVVTRIDRIDGDPDEREEWSAPRNARSSQRGEAAIGAAVDKAQRAIDAALGSEDPFE
jgi:hypothetical protein